MATISDHVRTNMALVQRLSFGVGVLGLGVSAVMLGFERKEFFSSYLIAYIYFLSLIHI